MYTLISEMNTQKIHRLHHALCTDTTVHFLATGLDSEEKAALAP